MSLIKRIEASPPSDVISEDLDLLLKRTQQGLLVLEQVCQSLRLSVCLCIFFVCLSVRVYVSLSLCFSVYTSLCLSVCVSVCVSLFVCLYISLSVCLCVSVCLSIHLFVYLFVCLSVCLSVVCLSICFSSCLSDGETFIVIVHDQHSLLCIEPILSSLLLGDIKLL